MANSTIINGTYDLTNIISRQAIESPPYWLAMINNELGGWMVCLLVAVFGIVMWVIQRNNGAPDSEAISYAGIICTVIVILLFVIQISALPGVKLFTWAQVVPFFVITCVALIANHISNRTY